MLDRIKMLALSTILMVWSSWVLAQATSPTGTTTGASPGGAPSGVTTNANPGGAPSGVTTNANPGGTSGEGLNWVWIALAVVVISGLLFLFPRPPALQCSSLTL